MMAARQGMVLAAERMGKFKTFLQSTSIGLLLGSHILLLDWGVERTSSLYRWAYGIGIATFILAAAITVISGLIYLIKYWAVLEKEQEVTS